jgi:serine/threonine protein kinase
MVQTVQDVFSLLLRSGLLPGEEARALLARWQGEAKDRAGDPQRFVAWLVANKQLTDYQGALLVRGFSEGFFLNEYKVLERLGRGRMAGVYKAQHRLGQIVAIKVLPPSKAREPNLKSRFEREAKLAMQLKHPNVVRSFQVGQSNGLHYLVMEHLEGETLADLIARRGKLLPSEAVRLMHQALLGLQHIHALGLVHRDLKPSNLMVVYPSDVPSDNPQAGNVKIVDIGLGRQMLEEGLTGDDTALTSEGIVLGTPDYMAPEQARDARSADIRADIYSLGCVLYHSLAGRPPFPDTNLLNLMIRHATEEPQPLRLQNAAVPDGLQQIVNWMMAKDPAERYPTPERAAKALEVFLSAGADPTPPPENDPGMRTYLTWLEGQVLHADLPAWLAQMDTMPASEVKKTRMALPEVPRVAPPARPSKMVPVLDSPRNTTEKTKRVRKLPPRDRVAQLTPPEVPAIPRPAAAVVPVTKTEPVAAERPVIEIPAIAQRPKRVSRREIIALMIGAATGAIVTAIGFAIGSGTEPPQADPGAAKQKKPRP